MDGDGFVEQGFPSPDRLPWLEPSAFADDGARRYCANKAVGGRKGWRLASFYELLSLVDPTAPGSPFLPVGHPFIDVATADEFWSTTTSADRSNQGLFSCL